ncbi:MAG: PhoH family protein [Candidatus Omnitrophica bacterium]|nr:PhoH family protein [Candidatus Omnitrophota bacterium]
MQKLVEIQDSDFIQFVFGVEDKNIKNIEERFKVNIFLRSGGILLKGEKEQLNLVCNLIKRMHSLFKKGLTLTDRDFDRAVFLPDNSEELEPFKLKVASLKKKFIFPKTQGQKKYVKSMQNFDITLSIGPAGTGKTYLAMAMAVNYLIAQKVKRIILTRPAIEAGESLGFLPGDVHEKLNPYLRPLYDALYDMMEPATIEEYLESGIIEIAPIAYMRGRTLNDAFVILDEAQNCTSDQLKMFLTRLGFDSKTVIAGDITQSDLPEKKPIGLVEALKILKLIKGISFIHLSKKDVVRHPLVQKIIQAYENYYKKA